MPNQNIAQNISAVQKTIEKISAKHQRSEQSTSLLAVSKTQAPSKILEAYQAGQRAFGENYLQEARDKQAVLEGFDIEWHFIGPIQSNKTKEIAENFSWVHSVDRLKIAQRLSQQRPDDLPPLNICLQVNIDNEPTKSGATISELPALAHTINQLPHINLRGLMAIPAIRQSPQEQLEVLQQVAQLQQQLQHSNAALALDTLSMGMSNDMDAAITAGSTIVRVGTAIFGPRITLDK